MRVISERDYRGYLIRFFSGHSESAYIKLGLSGLQAEIEFPSDWHEERRVWLRFGLCFAKVCFSFPWAKVVPDECQCSGPTYGFNFFGDGLHLHWGKQRGRRDDPFAIIDMPWAWRHREHKILGKPESHPYTYTLRSGEVQECTATITEESRLWLRPWIPYRLFKHSINIEFSDEVGEGAGSWKGGTIGCGWDMLKGETPLQALRRMEAERVFT